MPLHRLTTITVGVPDVAATAAFYREFGLEETTPATFATADGGEQLRLAPAKRRTLLELGVGVDDADDLDRIAANLTALHVDTARAGDMLRTTEPGTGVDVVARIAGPIRQTQDRRPPINRPGHYERTNARAAAVSAPGRARPRKLSHVVLGSRDATLSRRFFVAGLGFKVSDEVAPIGAAFMRCSEDHHNVLVQPSPVPFLHHTAWEVADVDEIGQGAKHMLADHPERHVWGLGRHCIGSNFFWYLRDPAGNFAEYSSDLDVIIDNELWKPEVWSGLDTLMAWGPPVPPSFLAPDDLAELMGG